MRGMPLPLLKGDFWDTSLTYAGICLDPFITKINHSCDPSAWLVCEGPEIRIRAVKDIETGEEITVSYLDNCEAGDYGSRRDELMRRWNIDCACKLCKQGDIGIKGDLRTRVLELQKLPRSQSNPE